MKQFLLLSVATLIFSLNASAMEIGETMPNLCWKNDQSQTVCMDDFKGKEKVLIFNAGWCGPCNSHMSELAQSVAKYEGKPVVFLSLSVDGWNHGGGASSTFLKEWKDKHHIPFPALAAGKEDIGLVFNPPHYIPADAIVDADNKLVFRNVGTPLNELFAEVDKHMPEESPIVPLPFPEPEH